MSYPNSRIFAATGAPITSVAIVLTNASTFPDFMIGAFRYALTGTTGPGLAQERRLSQAPTPSPAAMISPANGATLPGSTVTFRWSAGVGVSEYWLYLSKLAPGGKEIYSNAFGVEHVDDVYNPAHRWQYPLCALMVADRRRLAVCRLHLQDRGRPLGMQGCFFLAWGTHTYTV